MLTVWVCQREAKSASFKWKGENSRLSKERGNECMLRLLRSTGRTSLLSMNLWRRKKKLALVCWERGRGHIHTTFTALLTGHLTAPLFPTQMLHRAGLWTVGGLCAPARLLYPWGCLVTCFCCNRSMSFRFCYMAALSVLWGFRHWTTLPPPPSSPDPFPT